MPPESRLDSRRLLAEIERLLSDYGRSYAIEASLRLASANFARSVRSVIPNRSP
jgi:hypothetical protein